MRVKSGGVRGRRMVLLAVGVALGSGACTLLLGNEFSVETGGGGLGGTTATGGGGAGGSGGQGGVAYPYACAWQAAEHLQLATTTTDNQDRYEELFAVSRADDAALVVAAHHNATGMLIEVHGVQGNNIQPGWSFGADRLLDVTRLDAATIAILHMQVDNTVNPSLRSVAIEVVPDSDYDGSTAETRTVVADTELANLDPMGRIQGHFTATPDLGMQQADIVIAYRNSGGEYLEKYGHYAGGDVPATMVRITKPGLMLGESDLEAGKLIHAGGLTHYLVGEGGPNGLRGYALDASVTGPIDARTIGDDHWFPVALGLESDGVNVALASFGVTAPAALHAARLPFSNMSTFVGTDVPDVVRIDTLADFPSSQADIRWQGDIMTFVGTSQTDPLTLRYQFFDLLGRDRGAGPLPFTAPSATRKQISGVRMTRAGNMFDTIGDRFGVAWVEAQDAGAGIFDVLYHDQLGCYLK